MDWQGLQLPEPVAAELTTLVERYGEPIVCAVSLGSVSGQFGPRIRERALKTAGTFAPLGKSDRYGEVCMVVRRPDGTVITARKDYYPNNTFRLLTGGIGHGEPIEAALLREVAEETGLDVTVRRFLAAVSYFPTDPTTPPFHTFAFLVDEQRGTLGAVDPDERVAEFRMVPPHDLPQLATTLEQLGAEQHAEIAGLWSDWGRFRAVIHHLVAEALS